MLCILEAQALICADRQTKDPLILFTYVETTPIITLQMKIKSLNGYYMSLFYLITSALSNLPGLGYLGPKWV